MAVVIRLKRAGRRHRPFYRIEAMDKRTGRDGRCLDNIGYYDPLVQDRQKQVKMNRERLEYWIAKGARPSETVSSFLKKMAIKWAPPPKNRKSSLRKRRAQRRKEEGAAPAKKK